MPVHNTDIARIFSEVADLLEIEDANPFRVRAYRNAASLIGGLPRSVADMVVAGEDLTELEGIGEDLAGKIEEIVETDSLKMLRELEKTTSPELAELMRIPGLGPKRVRKLHDALGIVTRDELKQAAQQGRIRDVEGFGKKTEQRILDELERGADERRMLLMNAEEIATDLVEYLDKHDDIKRLNVAGSYRRRKETVGDLDVLAISSAAASVMDYFVQYEDVDEVLSKGETRSSVALTSGLQVDLRVVPKESYGAALLYFTGSKAHNIALREKALDQGLKINEYGVFDGDERIAGATEEDIYDYFDLAYIPPELREHRGELDAAQQGTLPDLVEVEQIRGNLHAHTTDSDGKASIEEMARAAKERGYDYLAITDHSPNVAVTQGVDAKELAQQTEAIDRLNDKLDGIRLLKSIEVDILKDGSLDLPDDILRELDLRVCSVHTNFNLSREQQTERILRAMDNPHFNILAHPTGRLINQRLPYDLDMERIMEAALERGCFLELNAQPTRLDINDEYCKMAKEMGLKIAISTDAHRPSELDYMRLGVWQARRGWLEADDVLNTRSWTELKKLLKRD